jgi:pimeloyl-ACP methyl ester carboxylesterase
MMRKAAMAACLLLSSGAYAGDFMSKVTDQYVDSNGVKIHYVKAGQGPLIVFIHGFPDFWYSWRHQMEGLMNEYTVVALDTRGYNLSDKPEGVENYDMSLLVGDVAAVIKNEGAQKAVIVGHDWGGAIAWSFAAMLPQMTDKLIIVNLPHLDCMARELANNPAQQANSQYARNFQQPDSHTRLNATMLATMVSRGDPEAKEQYQKAFENSSFDAMMNYYRRNYPKGADEAGGAPRLPRIQMPVLQFHGLTDTALLPGGLNNTWDYPEKDWTLVTFPGVGHWAHHEQPSEVTNMMRAWLKLHE